MIDYTNCNIEKVSVHHIGNKTSGEDIHLSKSMLDTSDIRLRELLLRFFIQPFSSPELYSFTFTNQDFTLNPLYNFASSIFEKTKLFHNNSVNIAKHLYELSTHPQIKSGDLFVVYFSDVVVDDEQTNAIGIFKSENKQAFLKLDMSLEDFILQYEDGINIEKMDKGCLIFNTDKDTGFKVCLVDKSNKNIEAQYWKDSFLHVMPLSDNYYHTKQFMDITKNFVAKQLSEEFEVSKADQIDLLNRSVDYFKTHDSFNKKEFEKEVFQDTSIIKSFKKFDESYRQTNEIEILDDFEISTQAVKKQARNFKSVLKLDKNFHIYIHGDKELIEKGVERDGRKFYKIYYQEEN